MKKSLTVLLSLLFISFQTANAETVGFGITGAYNFVEVSGTETTRTSNQLNSGDHSEEVLIPEIFGEFLLDNGGALGLSYIPTGNMGSKSRKDTNTEGSSGTYKAEAELENVFQIYMDIPTPIGIAGNDIYAKAGLQFATIATLESLNSGSTYPDEDVYGYSIGFGSKGDLAIGDGLYYKAEATYTDLGEYSAGDEAGTGNKVEADLESFAIKLSIGKKF
tara:strand:+ start:402 stop:1061 length:660 start_codon:yes stop_codon:yes gene_type:complete